MTASSPARAAQAADAFGQARPPRPETAPPPAEGDFDIVFQPDPTVWDGRFGNIAWLQELPKPLTKITWDNVIAISPAIAAAQRPVERRHGRGDNRRANRARRGLDRPRPGAQDHRLCSSATAAAPAATSRPAAATTPLPSGPASAQFLRAAASSGSRGQYPIATTQAHHRMDGFDFVREVTADNPRMPPPKETHTLYPDWNEQPDADHRRSTPGAW